MIYLGQPYSSPDPQVRDTRYLMAMAVSAYFANNGEPVYSPIMHWHECAKHFSLPTDARFWQKDNERMVIRADKFGALLLPGWQMSKGLRHESRLAARVGKRFFTVNIDALPYDEESKKISLPEVSITPVLYPSEFVKLFATDAVIEAYNGTHRQERDADRGDNTVPVQR